MAPSHPQGCYKIPPENWFEGTISQFTKLGVVGCPIDTITKKLTDDQLKTFKEDIFGHLFEMPQTFLGMVCHNIILRQVEVDGDGLEQLWFQLGKNYFRLSIIEWCLVTGLKCHGLDNDRCVKKKHRLYNTYFGVERGEKKLTTVDELYKRYNEIDFSKLRKEDEKDDALKVSLFFFVETVLLAQSKKNKMHLEWLEAADDLVYFRNLPWGRISWNCISKALNCALANRSSKYSLDGFVQGFQGWIFEAVGAVSMKYAIQQTTETPRICKWAARYTEGLRNSKKTAKWFKEESEPVNWGIRQTLQPTETEIAQEYWASVAHYHLDIPDFVQHPPLTNVGSDLLNLEQSPLLVEPTPSLIEEHPPFEDHHKTFVHQCSPIRSYPPMGAGYAVSEQPRRQQRAKIVSDGRHERILQHITALDGKVTSLHEQLMDFKGELGTFQEDWKEMQQCFDTLIEEQRLIREELRLAREEKKRAREEKKIAKEEKRLARQKLEEGKV